MEQVFIEGAKLALFSVYVFLFIAIAAALGLKIIKANAVYTYVFFVVSMLIPALYLLLWHFTFGRTAQEIQSTTGLVSTHVGLGQWGQILGGGIGGAVLTLGGLWFASWWKRPKFKVEFENVTPYCMRDDKRTPPSYFLRLRVRNSGRSVAKGCSGKITKFMSDSGEITDYEPVKLHWVGTDWGGMFYFETIDLARGEYDFLDVLVTRSDFQRRVFLFSPTVFETNPRELPSGTCRIQITIHGADVEPCVKEYSISWDGSNYTDIRLKEN